MRLAAILLPGAVPARGAAGTASMSPAVLQLIYMTMAALTARWLAGRPSYCIHRSALMEGDVCRDGEQLPREEGHHISYR
jgi:hypothetical protein